MLLINNKDNTFTVDTTVYLAGLLTSSISISDVNGDGKPDVVVGNLASDPSIGVFLNDGSGALASQLVYPSGGGYQLITADINGDGRTDVVRDLYWKDKLTINLNRCLP